MGATVTVNSTSTVVHKDSGGQAPSVPDVCKTPAPPGPPVPIPYPNIARSSDTSKGSKKVKMDKNPIMLKNSEFSTSMGDEAGTLKGIASSTTKGIAKFANYSFNVKVEGKNVPRLGDPMTNNGNMPNANTIKELQSLHDVTEEEIEFLCFVFCRALKEGEEAKRDARRGRSFTKRLKRYVEDLQKTYRTSPTWSNFKMEEFLPVMFGGKSRRCFPDIVLYDRSGRIKQIGDFKFPGDCWRGDQLERYGALAGEYKKGPEPMTISCDECECPECPPPKKKKKKCG